MADYGLTTTGFVPKTLEVIREEINDSMRSAFGSSIDLSDGTIEGQLAGMLAEREALLWEQMEAVNASQDPDSATGTGLDALCAITGTTREAATHSEVTLTLTGDDTTEVPSGSRASTESTEVEFETLEDAELVAVDTWAAATAYALDERVTKDDSGTDRVYQASTAGTSAGSGGPTGTGTAIVDGTVTWRYVGDGTAAVDVEAQAVDTGPLVASSGDITVIETPVSGWTSVQNMLDADVGSDVETDEALRIRRELELSAAGAATPKAIRAALLDVEDVISATIFENRTDTTDSDGVPPHAIEALVRGGDDQDILDALFAEVAAGIKTYGNPSSGVTGTVTDEEGTAHDVSFSRPDEIEIYVDVEVTIDSSVYPADGDDQIKEAIVTYGDAQLSGKNVVASALIAQCFRITGVLDVTVLHVGIASNPSASTTIAISLRELAVYDTSRITVATTPGTP